MGRPAATDRFKPSQALTEKSYHAKKHPIKIPLRSVKLKRKPSPISPAISTPFLSHRSRKSGEQRGLLSDFVQKRRDCHITDVVSGFEFSECAIAFCMRYSAHGKYLLGFSSDVKPYLSGIRSRA
jgi:hypothetical protein